MKMITVKAHSQTGQTGGQRWKKVWRARLQRPSAQGHPKVSL